MQAPHLLQPLYERLAKHYARQGDARKRDHCLLLAADAALRAGEPEQAERLRQRLLVSNPHHLLRPFSSLAEALQSRDVEDYVKDLRRYWSPEVAEERLYQSLMEVDPAPKNDELDMGTYKLAPVNKPREKATLSDRAGPARPPATGGSFIMAMLLFLIGLAAAGGLLFVVIILPLMG